MKTKCQPREQYYLDAGTSRDCTGPHFKIMAFLFKMSITTENEDKVTGDGGLYSPDVYESPAEF